MQNGLYFSPWIEVLRDNSLPSCLAPLDGELVVVVKVTTVIVSIVVFGNVVHIDVFFLIIVKKFFLLVPLAVVDGAGFPS